MLPPVIASSIVALCVSVSLVGEPVAAASTTSRDPVATAAFAEAQQLAAHGHHDQAIAKLDLASELEPEWAEPVELRAKIFGELAERYEPSRTFTAAQASELERLVELQPDRDAERRRHEIAALKQQSNAAAEVERKRRRLVIPAGALVFTSAGFLLAGVLLYSMKPREALMPGAAYQYRRDRAGIALMSIGAILAPPAIALAVLAGRQAKRDSATRDFEIEAGRPRPRRTIAVAPTVVRRGGGVGFAMRF